MIGKISPTPGPAGAGQPRGANGVIAADLIEINPDGHSFEVAIGRHQSSGIKA
jgi:hypothetical protein